jgi:predicted amidohydrolase
MKIAVAQINPVVGDFDYNVDKIIEFYHRIPDDTFDLLVFPELALSGYPPRDLLEKQKFIDANNEALKQIMGKIKGIGVICGMVKRTSSNEGNSLYNTAVLFEDGNILHSVHKRLLPTYDIFDETRYFEPGNDISVFKYKGRNIGLTICEDIWNDKEFFKRRMYHIDPLPMLIEQGADLIINISASVY